MMKGIGWHTAAGLCAVLLFCSAWGVSQDVRYNYAEGTDFSKYKTYKWAVTGESNHPDPLTDNQIQQAIDSQLALKGLTKSDGDNADMYVAYEAAMSEEKQWNATGMGGPVRWGRMGTASSSTIQIGTLVVTLYDAAAKQVVWRGDATKTLNPSKDPQKNHERLQKAVAKLMKKYPPPVKN